MLCCTQMPSTGVVDRSSPLAEEPSTLLSSQPCPACVSLCTWWRFKRLSRLWEASTVCSTRSVVTSLMRPSDQVSLQALGLIFQRNMSTPLYIKAGSAWLGAQQTTSTYAYTLHRLFAMTWMHNHTRGPLLPSMLKGCLHLTSVFLMSSGSESWPSSPCTLSGDTQYMQ